LLINPTCNFRLIVIDNNISNDTSILFYEHCLYIKLAIDKPIGACWRTDYLNWDKIFLDIENNIALVPIPAAATTMCLRSGCIFLRHSNMKNNGGTHCCYACKRGVGHGPACEKVIKDGQETKG
jgi:hypothetical protein